MKNKNKGRRTTKHNKMPKALNVYSNKHPIFPSIPSESNKIEKTIDYKRYTPSG